MSKTGGDFGNAAKDTVLGVLRGTKEVGDQALDAGGNLGSAAKGAVEGAIAGAKEVGLNTEEAASSAAVGALKAADKISSAAAAQVHAAVTGTIAGVKVFLERKSARTR